MRQPGRGFTIVMMLVCAAFSACSKVPHYELSRFIDPDTCGGCHDAIYRQWKGSMHGLSHVDRVYREIAIHDLNGLTDRDEIKEAEHCVACHTPIGFLSGMPAGTSDHAKKIPELAQKGVQCDFCHSSTGARNIYNAQMKLDPGNGESDPGTKRGPLKDSRSDFHRTAYSEFHTRSEFCGVCHDVRHVVFGTRLETPYEEWRNGPYAAKGVQCQGCHMYQRPGVPATGSTARPDNPGEAAAGGPVRGHVFTHYFVGGNNVVPHLYGNRELALMAEERLKNAATVKIGDNVTGGVMQLTVTNAGAGHSIPTGLAHVRQIWLEVTVTGSDGRVLYTSGKPDAAGMIAQPAVVYNTVFGDGNGRPVMNVAKARSVLKDRRIGPLKSVVESYRLPETREKWVTAEARLWYRIAPQELVDSVLGKGKLKIIPVLMAYDKKRLAVK